MATIIEDGTGKGFSAKVDGTNRLEVRSVTEDAALEGAINGETYVIGTPFLTQINDSANGVLYFKFDEDVSLFTKTFSSQARWASGATFQNYLVNVYKNVNESSLTGTWVNFNPLNTNFGSADQISGTFKYGSPSGAGGFTGLTPSFQLAFPVNVYNQISANLIFPKGVGILLAITPPSGNVQMPVSFSLTVTKLNNF
jgi:hypothetical protein